MIHATDRLPFRGWTDGEMPLLSVRLQDALATGAYERPFSGNEATHDTRFNEDERGPADDTVRGPRAAFLRRAAQLSSVN